MYVSAIVVAAGKGLRFKSKTAKPLVKINRQPIIIYSLSVLARNPQIQEIIVVVNSHSRKAIQLKIKKYRIAKIKSIVLGGDRRKDSVANGLKAISARSDLVLIHDAARLFIDERIVSSVIKEAEDSGAAIVGVPVKATIKIARSGTVTKTLPRGNLWEAQTPQVFKKELILKAHKRFAKFDATDDASLVEMLKEKVKIVDGSYYNIKITTPEDLLLAGLISKRCC